LSKRPTRPEVGELVGQDAAADPRAHHQHLVLVGLVEVALEQCPLDLRVLGHQGRNRLEQDRIVPEVVDGPLGRCALQVLPHHPRPRGEHELELDHGLVAPLIQPEGPGALGVHTGDVGRLPPVGRGAEHDPQVGNVDIGDIADGEHGRILSAVIGVSRLSPVRATLPAFTRVIQGSV
jgi:hypothetical protein